MKRAIVRLKSLIDRSRYLLAGLEPGRFQVQILHERDSCCFSPQGRHDQMLGYQHNVRAELMASDRRRGGAGSGGGKTRHGWFTTTADDHTKHEVAAQDKSIIAAVASAVPGEGGWLPGTAAGNNYRVISCVRLHLPGSRLGARLILSRAPIHPSRHSRRLTQSPIVSILHAWLQRTSAQRAPRSFGT